MPRETQKARIERLENELEELKQLNDTILQDNRRLSKELMELQDQKDADFLKLPVYRQLMDKISCLKAQNKILQRQLDQAQKKNDLLVTKLNTPPEPTHNARGAGRKACDAKQQAQYQLFRRLVASGKDMDEIMGQMQISRATYYRYKKSINN